MIDDETLATLVRMARFFLTSAPDGSVTPALLESVAAKAVGQLLEGRLDEERQLYRQAVVRSVSEGRRVKIADEKMLVDGPLVDWYFGERLRTRPLWDRYRRHLSFNVMLGPATVAAVDRSSDQIVGQLGDPRQEEPFDRRGVVVGQVQSGKTTSYAAVINKAIDAGYRFIVVLTGIHESLRVQTQKRLEEGVRGLATEDGKRVAKDTVLPIHRLATVPSPPNFLTTRMSKGDFSDDARHFANATDGTLMLVVKKNAKILRHLNRFLASPTFSRIRNPTTGNEEISGRALLVVDDEADNASVDNSRPDPSDRAHDPSAINSEIRRLLLRFRQRAYVGYTATPYANILIHKDNEAHAVGQDLFPKDFIVMLSAPSNYLGPTTFFGSTTVDETRSPPALLRIIDDCGTDGDTDWMTVGHSKTHVPRFQGQDRIPPSLEDAIMGFLLAAAVRQLRGRVKAHNSMLIHVSRYKAVQNKVRTQIDSFLYEMKGELDGIGSERNLVERLDELYANDVTPTTCGMPVEDWGDLPPFTAVRNRLRDLLDQVQLRVVNSEAQTDLDYDQYPDGLSVICVGGDKLSRGLTLEGLSVSYFLRATRMYDTLMQMGRWFGYRPEYKDLCRLHLTRELLQWYQHVTRADEDLRAEFQTLQDQGARPTEFGLRVRSHPTLLVTAPAKMSSAEKFDLSFGGRVTQTIHLFRDPAALEKNARTVRAFLTSLSSFRAPHAPAVRRNTETGAPQPSQPLPGVLHRGVPLGRVREFLQAFEFHPEARRVAGPQLLEFLSRASATGVVNEWSVLVGSGGIIDGDNEVEMAPGIVVVPISRATRPPVAQAKWSEEHRGDTINLGVLSSPVDLIADLLPEEVERFRMSARAPDDGIGSVVSVEREKVARNRACLARNESRGLLVLYAVRPTTTQASPIGAKGAVEFAPGSSLPIGLAIAIPRCPTLVSVEYVVNSVMIDELERRFETSAGDEVEAPLP